MGPTRESAAPEPADVVASEIEITTEDQAAIEDFKRRREMLASDGQDPRPFVPAGSLAFRALAAVTPLPNQLAVSLSKAHVALRNARRDLRRDPTSHRLIESLRCMERQLERRQREVVRYRNRTG